jgi:hypothetical protein
MSKRTFAVLSIVFVAALAMYFSTSGEKIDFRDFKWSNVNRTASYHFVLDNITDKQAEMEITLVAANVGSMHMTGVGSYKVGASTMTFNLMPHEEKSVNGTMNLSVEPTGSLILTPYFKTVEPNQSTDPTPASGTPPAGQESRHP